jgi:periplasmic protein TonB
MKRVRLSPEMLIAGIGSLALHAIWFAADAQASHLAEPTPAEVLLFEAEMQPLPPPPQPALPEPTLPELPQAAPSAPAPAKHISNPTRAAPAAAQAGRTLTAPETSGETQLADFTLVQGTGLAYAGGTTTVAGTSQQAVHGPIAERRVSLPPAAPSVPAGPDRSRSPRPEVANWDCSRLFPTHPEAGHRAAVLISVTVLPNGSPRSVTVLRDPGLGFGPAARSCAMGQRYLPALDRNGVPVTATTPPITVRFTR